MRRLFVAAIALACLNAPALASHRNYHHHSAKASVHGRHYARHGGAWCGAYMRHVFGATDPLLNLARNWASVGSNAGGPQVGAVVVWAHHVGVIRGGPNSAGEWLVEWVMTGMPCAPAIDRCAGRSRFALSAAAAPSLQRTAARTTSPARYARSNPNEFAWWPDTMTSVHQSTTPSRPFIPFCATRTIRRRSLV